MLTVKDVSFQCMGPNAFERGRLIYKVRNVTDFTMEKTKDENKILVKAKVKGSNVADYEVMAYVNETLGKVERADCECPAFNSYAGLCKHCVAMLMEYIEKRDGGLQGNLPVIRRNTDLGFCSIIDKFSLRKRVGYIQPEITGKVQLEPQLMISRDELLASFHIGISSMYQIKNFRNFLDEVKGVEKAYYGKNLEFYNTSNAYTKESQEMLQFILRCEDNDFSSNCKALVLRSSILDEFMDIMMNRCVLVDQGMAGKAKMNVREKMPDEIMKIEGVEDGILIHMNRQQIWYGRKYAYLFAKNDICRVNREVCQNLASFIRYSNAYSTGIFVSRRELPMFVRDLLPEVKQIYQVQETNFKEAAFQEKKAKFKIYLDAPEKDIITCKAYAFYGEEDEGINIFDKNLPQGERDLSTELMVASKIHSMFNAFDPEQKNPVLSDDDDRLYALLTEGLDILRGLGEVFVSDRFKGIRVKTSPKVQLGISLRGDLLELEMSGGEMPVDQLAEILSRYDRKRQYFRLKNGDFIHIDHEGIGALARISRELQLSSKELAKGKVRVPKYRSMYIEERFDELQNISYYYNDEFRELTDRIKHYLQTSYEVPAEMKPVLREYQIDGFQWLMTLKQNGFGAILADEMGLGKTLQTIAMLLACDHTQPSLIICPASLVYNWQSEICRFAPSLSTVLVSGTVENRIELLQNIENTDVVITSYDLLKRDIEWYEDKFFECQIIDEAQYIKNHNTQVAKAVKLIHAGFKVALTGTPVENRLSELWSIFDYIMPGFLYSYHYFRENIEKPIVIEEEKGKLVFLQHMINPFVLRRLKKDVLQFLPDKIEKNMYAKMEGEQWDLYRAHIQRMQMMLEHQSENEFKKSKIQVLAELTKLRQICCNPGLIYEKYGGESAKTVLCMELIKDAIEGKHKILVFSQFTSMLEIIQQNLKKEKIEYITLTGATSKEKRAELVEEFNQGNVPVFCISLKAGGTGLNLTAADIVIHYDPWWNVAVQNQATDRAHRIGQKNVVTVYKLIAKDSIEERIVELQDKKKELAGELLGSEEISSTELNREMLLDLLK